MATSRSNRSSLNRILLLLIIVMQFAVMVYFGIQKEGYHVDEIFSYGLSNSYYTPFIQKEPEFGYKWYSGKEIADYLIVNDNEKFTYDSVVYNQEQDVHPPLYYFLLHTVSSFFSETFSKWFGIGINLVCFGFIDFILYQLVRRISGDYKTALLALTIWGFSAGAINMVTFIRMYALLSLWTILFIYLHHFFFDEQPQQGNIPWKRLLLLGFVTILGSLTQYYFLVFAFFFCGVWCLVLLWHKKWKMFFSYTLCEIFSVLLSIVLFPAMLKHIFSEYRGEEAFSNIAESENWLEHIKTYLSIFSHSALWGCLKIFGICIGVFLVCWIFQNFVYKISFHFDKSTGFIKLSGSKHNHFAYEWRITPKMIFCFLLFLACSLYFLLVTRISPYRTDRYIMILFPVSAFYLSLIINKLAKKILAKNSFYIVIALVMIFSIFSWNLEPFHYLYTSHVREEITDQYSELPVIVLYEGNWGSVIFLNELMMHPATFFCSENSLDPLKECLFEQNLSQGFLLYVDTLNEEETKEKLREVFTDEVEIEQLTTNRGDVYLVENAEAKKI